MAYFLASIISVVAATVIMLTRYEADDSQITADLEQMKTMFLMVDGFVNTYINSGASMADINFELLDDSGILIENSVINGVGTASVMTLPNNIVRWHLIPNRDNISSYKLLVDVRQSRSMMSKSRFVESFVGREYCENMLFGSFETLTNTFQAFPTPVDFVNNGAGTNADGLFVCVVFK